MKQNIHFSILIMVVVLVAAAMLVLNDDEESPPISLHKSRIADRPSSSPEPILPIEYPSSLKVEQVALGKRLFGDARLSTDGESSCETCHQLETGGAIRELVPVGDHGNLGEINTPTVFNSALNASYYWDGRADTVEQQIAESLISPTELDSSWAHIIEVINGDSDLLRQFRMIFKDGVTRENVIAVIMEFERSLITPNSRFDQYLNGDNDALSKDEKRGYQLFKVYGCVSCHQGANVGGNLYQVLGVMQDYYFDREDLSTVNYGRFNVTGREEDRYRFRVPSLRNVTLTAPYFHNGFAETIEQAIMVMASYQLGRKISVGDVDLIAKFLHTLTGEYNGERL
ncbi:MAG: cytochrome-c peroxidase [Gammaproteobacteria bacterium]